VDQGLRMGRKAVAVAVAVAKEGRTPVTQLRVMVSELKNIPPR